MTRAQLDDIFPTLVRYIGLVTMVVLVVLTILARNFDYSAGFVAATGMILYKSVHNAAKGISEDES